MKYNFHTETLDWENLINEKVILNGVVTGTNYNRCDKTEDMIVEIPEKIARHKQKVVVKRTEADNIFSSGTMNYLVGCSIPFVIIEKIGETVYGSRRIAQDMLFEQMKDNLISQEVFTGEILSFTPYGAFISVDGIVGMLKNTDFSIDHTAVSSVHCVGDQIQVFCKKCDFKSKKMYFEAYRKYCRPEPATPDFSVGSVIIGEVVGLKTFNEIPFAFIRVADGLDVMADASKEPDLTFGQRCKVQITTMRETDKPAAPFKIRGVIRGVI